MYSVYTGVVEVCLHKKYSVLQGNLVRNIFAIQVFCLYKLKIQDKPF